MTTHYIIVEDQFDRDILEKILPENIVSHSKFIVGNGYQIAISKARSVLVSSELPVVLVVNAKTTETSSVMEKKDFITQFLSQLAVPDRFQIVLAVPEVAILFFHDRDVLEQIIQGTVTDNQWETGHYHPRKTLSKLFNTENVQQVLSKRLTPEILDSLRNTEFIQNIIQRQTRNKTFPKGAPPMCGGSGTVRNGAF